MYIWSIIPLIACTTYIVLFILTLPSIRRRVNRVFAFYLAVSAIWSFTSFMLHLEAPPRQTLFWNEVLIVAMVWTLITYYQFVRAYTKRPTGKGIYLGYAFLLGLSVLSLGGYLIEYSYVKNGVLNHSLGNSVYFIGAICLVFIVAIIYELLRRYRGSTSPVERNRTAYLIAGWSSVVLFTYTNLVPELSEYPLDHIGTLINALLISYSISRLQLLDIGVAARRGLTYFILLLILVATFATTILEWLWIYPNQPSYVVLSIVSGLAILVTLMGIRLKRGIQERVDRFFYGGTYKYRQVLVNFSVKMSNIIELNALASEMLPIICLALRIKQAKLLFPVIDGGDYTTQFVYPEKKNGLSAELKFKVDNPIVTWLSKNASSLEVNEIDCIPELKGLWEEEREKLLNSKLKLICPIDSRGKLIGILGLGEKESTAFYSQEDIQLLMSLASQAGIVIENARLYSEAITRAHTDALTKLHNHRYFHERLEQEIARGSRFGNIFSLIMLDIDHFKAYNDSYGHLAGDEVLRKVGECIYKSIRSIDMAFRYGGEEFTVLLIETPLADAYKVAERIRKTIESNVSRSGVSITVSLGIASWPIDGMLKEELIARADAAMYQAKRTGRNKTCLSSDISEPTTKALPTKLETKTKTDVIYALAATVDAKDSYTYGHSRKVSRYAVALAESINLPTDRIAIIRAAGLLHDIGKIGIPDSILSKKGPLTEEERQSVRAHLEVGADILRHVDDLAECLPAVLHHHEYYDGNGYPSNLKGEAIPIEARILAIADAYDAMTSPRPYREQLSPHQALDELKRCAGTQFDSKLVDAFRKVIGLTPSGKLRLEKI